MSKKEERRERLDRLSKAIDDQPAPQRGTVFPISKNIEPDPEFKGESLPKRHTKTYEEIAHTRKFEIPKCSVKPYNGRIFVRSYPGDETTTDGGIILPFKMKDGKDGTMKDVRRYFVVAFDEVGIPKEIADDLYIGKEVNPFLPSEAEEWSLPKVIDWDTKTVFECIHYTELAGGNMVKSEKISD
jgi:hypothetical protein